VLNRAPAHVRAGEWLPCLQHGRHVVEAFLIVQEVEAVQSDRRRENGHGGAAPEHHDSASNWEPNIVPVRLTVTVVASLRRGPQPEGMDPSSALVLLHRDVPHHHHEVAEEVEEVAADGVPRLRDPCHLVTREG
jgi:hypothetical protein